MSKPKVVMVGHVCIDHNKTEHAAYTSWGSGTLYMSAYAQSHLGLSPDVLTTYGTDFAPYSKDFRLQPAKAQTSQTLVYENIIANGQRTQFCQHWLSALTPVLDAAAKRLLAQADILVLATLLPNYSTTYIEEIFKCLKPNCLKICCPQGYFREITLGGTVQPRAFPEAAELLKHFDLAVLSEEDHPEATSLCKQWKQAGCPCAIVITQAAAGANIALDNGSLHHVPTIPIAESDIIDSVGCGDVFAMALACSYYELHDLELAVKSAHLAAREKLLSRNASTSH